MVGGGQTDYFVTPNSSCGWVGLWQFQTEDEDGYRKAKSGKHRTFSSDVFHCIKTANRFETLPEDLVPESQESVEDNILLSVRDLYKKKSSKYKKIKVMQEPNAKKGDLTFDGDETFNLLQILEDGFAEDFDDQIWTNSKTPTEQVQEM